LVIKHVCTCVYLNNTLWADEDTGSDDGADDDGDAASKADLGLESNNLNVSPGLDFLVTGVIGRL